MHSEQEEIKRLKGLIAEIEIKILKKKHQYKSREEKTLFICIIRERAINVKKNKDIAKRIN